MIFNWWYAHQHSCLSAQALPLVLSRIPAGIVSRWAFLSNVGERTNLLGQKSHVPNGEIHTRKLKSG
jgi:hypothetical protein